mmetsp:Transcript_383/g.724  ORF Transcript_383/g.724 Transcript_383/m.724 type:complete len:615 (+) Transcript_383:143-1987(+)
MDPNGVPTSTQQQQSPPPFDINSIFTRLFSDDHIASWLLSHNELPPTALTPDLMKFSITCDMVASADRNEVEHMFQRSSASRSSSEKTTSKEISRGHSSENHSQPLKQQPEQKDMPKLIDVEKLVFVRHASTAEKAYFSVTDTRMPFSFLEPPCAAVPGVRRGISVRSSYDLLIGIHYWLQDSRSILLFMTYPFDKRIPIVRGMFLLRVYPSNRYPNASDILESAMIQELVDCQFCFQRGYPKCECLKSIADRTRPALPAADQRDPWSLWSFFFKTTETGFKKQQISLWNRRQNMNFSTIFFYSMKPTYLVNDKRVHRDGFQYYINTLSPYLNSKMLTWNMPNQPLVDTIPSTHHPMTTIEDLPTPPFRNSPSFNNAQPSSRKRSAHELTPNSVSKRSHMDPSYSRRYNGPEEPTRAPSSAMTLEMSAALILSATPSDSNKEDGGGSSSRAATLILSGKPVHPLVIQPGLEVIEQPSQSDPLVRDLKDLDPASEEYRIRVTALMDELDAMKWTPDLKVACQVCSLEFSRKYDMKRHIKTAHLPDREFQCTICGAEFKRKQHVEGHYKQVHEKSTSFGCSYCDKTFISDSNRRRHIRAVHGTMQYNQATSPFKPE